MAVNTMETDLMTWLDMVWGALSEEDADKRVNLLNDANSFLSERRESAGGEVPELAEVRAS